MTAMGPLEVASTTFEHKEIPKPPKNSRGGESTNGPRDKEASEAGVAADVKEVRSRGKRSARSRAARSRIVRMMRPILSLFIVLSGIILLLIVVVPKVDDATESSPDDGALRGIPSEAIRALVTKCLELTNRDVLKTISKKYFVEELKDRLKESFYFYNAHLTRLKGFNLHNISFHRRVGSPYARALLVMKKAWMVAWHWKIVKAAPVACQIPVQIISVEFSIPETPQEKISPLTVEVVDRPKVYCERVPGTWQIWLPRKAYAEAALAELFHSYVSHYVKLSFSESLGKIGLLSQRPFDICVIQAMRVSLPLESTRSMKQCRIQYGPRRRREASWKRNEKLKRKYKSGGWETVEGYDSGESEGGGECGKETPGAKRRTMS